jgi:hypothetical protein
MSPTGLGQQDGVPALSAMSSRRSDLAGLAGNRDPVRAAPRGRTTHNDGEAHNLGDYPPKVIRYVVHGKHILTPGSLLAVQPPDLIAQEQPNGIDQVPDGLTRVLVVGGFPDRIGPIRGPSRRQLRAILPTMLDPDHRPRCRPFGSVSSLDQQR